MLLDSLNILVLSLLGLLGVGTLLSLSNHPHWLVRGWDFPRVQIIVIGWVLAMLCGLISHFGMPYPSVPMWAVVSFASALTLWHGFLILPYTPVMPKQAASTQGNSCSSDQVDPQAIRIVVTNVELENEEYALWINTIAAVDPDIVLVVEPDAKWLSAIASFIEQFPYRVAKPQDNWYGMLLLSKLPIEDHQIRYLVQRDVPSIDAKIRLNEKTSIRFVGVHPRPPEPLRGNDATARDAELTLWGRELESDEEPVIIGGDLNDVAWSQTTRLFLRTSGLLDPRRGRGLFNTFHVNHSVMRFPLDHVFHSADFTVSGLKRLAPVGSDHFPIMIDLRHMPSEKDQHEMLESNGSDQQEIELRVQRATEDDNCQGEAVVLPESKDSFD